jgi:RecB family exonuclease
MAKFLSNRFFFCRDEAKRRFENCSFQILMEDMGKLVIPYDRGEFFLTARADRIDLFSDPEAEIIDYKTGHIPTDIRIKGRFARH